MKFLIVIKVLFIVSLLPSLSFASDEVNKVEDCIRALRNSDVEKIVNQSCYNLESKIIARLAKDNNFNRKTLLQFLSIQKEFFEEKKYHKTVVMGKTIIGLIEKNPDFEDIERRANFTNAYAYGFLNKLDKSQEILLDLLRNANIKKNESHSIEPYKEEVLGRLIMLYFSTKYWDLAIDYTNKMLDLQKEKYGTRSKKVKTTLTKIELFRKKKIEDEIYNKAIEEIEFFIEKKDYSSVMQICENLIEDLKKIGSSDSTINATYLNLVQIYFIANKHNKAEEILLYLADNVSDKSTKPKKEEILKALVNLYSKTNKPEKLLTYYKISANYLKSKYGADNSEYIKVRKNVDEFEELFKKR